VPGHWGTENPLHWVLDSPLATTSRACAKGHGAKNMAIVRHFAINLVRAATDRKSIKLRRKIAGWDPNYLAERLGATIR
jgi:predicted transposase YbfD/YdcC